MGYFGGQLKGRRITLLSVILSTLLCFPANAKSPLLDKKDDGSYLINLEVRFAPGSKRFHPRFKQELKKLANLLKKNSDIPKVTIVGHTDNKGSERLNRRLSKVRANYVRNYLTRFGLSKKRFEIVAKAGEQPRYPTNKRWGQRKNRRVEFEIPGFAAKAPAETPPEISPEAPAVVSAEVKTSPEEAAVRQEPPSDDDQALASKPAAPSELPAPVVEQEEGDPSLAEKSEPEIQDTGPTYLDEPMIGSTPRAWWEEYLSRAKLQEYAPLVSLSATGLFLGTGLTLGMIASEKQTGMEENVFGNDDWKAARDSSRNYAISADVFFTLSTLTAVGSAWLFYEYYFKSPSYTPAKKIELIPTSGGVFFKLELPFDFEGGIQE